MRKKIDLAKKVVTPTPMINKKLRPTYQNHIYQSEPETLDTGEYNDDFNQNEISDDEITTDDSININSSTKSSITGNAAISTTEKIMFVLKHPIVIKILAIVIIIVILIILISIILSVISGAGTSDHSVLMENCPQVTVINSGCNSKGENCNNKYDGEVSFEDYIAGVIAAEHDSDLDLEYYKLQAIVIRTYTLSYMEFDCEVEGNINFQKYIDVNDSSSSEIIKQAVEETKGIVMTEVVEEDDFLIRGDYSSACVVNADNNYYYVRYGKLTLEETKIQKIPKEWASNSSTGNKLKELYYKSQGNSNNYNTIDCPDGTNDYGMSTIGALYLYEELNYTKEEILKYYYQDNLVIKEIEIETSDSVKGFTNPTSSIYCTSAYGYRTHPVKGQSSFHSGLDIGLSGGTPIYAAKSGTITRVEKNVSAINNCNYGYGNYIVIDHGDGTATLYAHMKYGSIPSSIYKGAKVTQGTQIGQVGSTGCSTGNHLHYEVQVNGKTTDPANYLDLTNAKGTCKR